MECVIDSKSVSRANMCVQCAVDYKSSASAREKNRLMLQHQVNIVYSRSHVC